MRRAPLVPEPEPDDGSWMEDGAAIRRKPPGGGDSTGGF